MVTRLRLRANFACVQSLDRSLACYILDAQGACQLAPNRANAPERAGSGRGLAISDEAQKGTIGQAGNQKGRAADPRNRVARMRV
jgi:hypothetical protein